MTLAGRTALVTGGRGGIGSAVVERLLHQAHDECYIASSLTTDVVLEPVIVTAAPSRS